MTAAWKRFRWMAFPSMKREKMPSESPSNARLISEFTPVQENSNEDELAGPSAWLPDPCEHVAGGECGTCSDAGARRRKCARGGDLSRCHHESADSRRCACGRRG